MKMFLMKIILITLFCQITIASMTTEETMTTSHVTRTTSNTTMITNNQTTTEIAANATKVTTMQHNTTTTEKEGPDPNDPKAIARRCLFGNGRRQEVILKCFKVPTVLNDCSQLLHAMDCFIKETRKFCDDFVYNQADWEFYEFLDNMMLNPNSSRPSKCKDALVENSFKYKCEVCTVDRPRIDLIGDPKYLSIVSYESQGPKKCLVMKIKCKPAENYWTSSLNILVGEPGLQRTDRYNRSYGVPTTISLTCNSQLMQWEKDDERVETVMCNPKQSSNRPLPFGCGQCNASMINFIGNSKIKLSHSEKGCRLMAVDCPYLPSFRSRITVGGNQVLISEPEENVRLKLTCVDHKGMSVWMSNETANVTEVICKENAVRIDGCGTCTKEEVDLRLRGEQYLKLSYEFDDEGCRVLRARCYPATPTSNSTLEYFIYGLNNHDHRIYDANVTGEYVERLFTCKPNGKQWEADPNPGNEQYLNVIDCYTTTPQDFDCANSSTAAPRMHLEKYLDQAKLMGINGTTTEYEMLCYPLPNSFPIWHIRDNDGNSRSPSAPVGKPATFTVNCVDGKRWEIPGFKNPWVAMCSS